MNVFFGWRWSILKKYDIWHKASNNIKKEFDSELVYNKNFLRNKRKSYGDNAIYSHDKEIPEVGTNYSCLAVTINFILKKDENHYPKVFLKKCKYIEKEKKWLDILF